jgi:hypothetical protein
VNGRLDFKLTLTCIMPGINDCTRPSAMTPAETLPTLHRLLDRSLELPPEPRPQLTSHLPMALQALHALGAGRARLQACFDAATGRFEGQAAPASATPVADWRALRGRGGLHDSFAPLRATFQAALAQEGADAVLRRTLPDLLPGVAAAAFHGPIRLAHAVQAGHPGELAAALAYWAWRWQATAKPVQQDGTLGFEDWAVQLVQAAPLCPIEGPLIAVRMQAAEQSAPYQALAGRLHLERDTLARLSVLAAQRYAATRSFTVLHIVTGLRALRVLSPWLEEAALTHALSGLVHAVTSAYFAARMSQWPELAPAPLLSWPEIVAAAVQSQDEHVTKLAQACSESAALLGDLPFRAAASRAVEA